MKKIVAIVLSAGSLGLAWAGGAWAAGEEEVTIQDQPLSHWLREIQSENRGFQLRAARVLAEAPTNRISEIVPKLVPILAAARENSRFPVAQVLGEYGPAARAAVPHLLPVLEGTQYERNRAAAAKALGQILKDAPPSEEIEKVTTALIRLFADKYVDVRRESVRACGMIGPAAKACLKHLDGPLAEPDTENGDGYTLRNGAAWTCGRMGPLGAVHIDRLIALMHRDSKTGWGAALSPVMAEALGRIGPVNDKVVPNLVDAMETRGKWQGGWVIIPFFSQAVDTLASFGPKAAPAVPYLDKLAREKARPDVAGDVALLINVVKALGAIGPEAKEAVPALEALRSFKVPRPEQEKELIKEVETALNAVQGKKGKDEPASP